MTIMSSTVLQARHMTPIDMPENVRYTLPANAIPSCKNTLSGARGELCPDNRNVALAQLRAAVSRAPRRPFWVRPATAPLAAGFAPLGDLIPTIIEISPKEVVVISQTRRVVAVVENIEAIGNRAVAQCPRETMCVPHLPSPRDLPVPSPCATTRPEPAFTGFVNLAPQSSGQVKLGAVVAPKEPQWSPFGVPPALIISGGQLGLVPTTAVTEPVGDARIGEHGEDLLRCAAPRAVISSAGAFARPHYNTLGVR